MPRNVRFWRNVTLIGLAHTVLIVGLVRLSRDRDKQDSPSIVWINGGAGKSAAIPAKTIPRAKPVNISTPPPERVEEEEEKPELAPAKSDIQLSTPAPTPRSTSTPRPTPAVKTTPKPTPKPKPSPKPTSKPAPKKILLAKASPKPTPKPSPRPTEAAESDEETKAEEVKKEIAKAALAKNETEKPVKEIAGTGKGTSPGPGGQGGGSGGESPFGWYGSMLHDRFYSEWVQPTTVIPSSAKLAVLVKLRIEKDGRVSSFEILKPSNNVIIDESVAAVAKRVTQVDPLPAGLVKGDHYDVRINFELNND